MKTQDFNNCSSINYSSIIMDSNRMSNSNLLKRQIVKFVLKNVAGFENLTFLEKLEDLEKLEWVFVHEDSFERNNTLEKFESHFLDIHFERQNRHGRHLLVGRYPYENNRRKYYYIGFYLTVESIENGTLYFSVVSFTSRYQNMRDLKNAVAIYEMKNNCFCSEVPNNFLELSEKYLNN